MRFLSASDDEVGGLHGAIRAERAERRRSAGRADESVEKELILRNNRFVGSDEEAAPSEHRSERSEPFDAASGASHSTQRAQASGAIKYGSRPRRAEEERADTLFRLRTTTK
jgi:hypothetical protein